MKNKNNIFNFFKSSSLKKLKPFKYIEILKPFHINNPLVSMAYDHHKLYKSYSNDLDGLEFVFHELKYKKSLYEKLGIINSLNYKNIIDKFNSISIQKEWVDAISYMTENYPDYNLLVDDYDINLFCEMFPNYSHFYITEYNQTIPNKTIEILSSIDIKPDILAYSYDYLMSTHPSRHNLFSNEFKYILNCDKVHAIAANCNKVNVIPAKLHLLAPSKYNKNNNKRKFNIFK